MNRSFLMLLVFVVILGVALGGSFVGGVIYGQSRPADGNADLSPRLAAGGQFPGPGPAAAVSGQGQNQTPGQGRRGRQRESSGATDTMINRPANQVAESAATTLTAPPPAGNFRGRIGRPRQCGRHRPGRADRRRPKPGRKHPDHRHRPGIAAGYSVRNYGNTAAGPGDHRGSNPRRNGAYPGPPRRRRHLSSPRRHHPGRGRHRPLRGRPRPPAGQPPARRPLAPPLPSFLLSQE